MVISVLALLAACGQTATEEPAPEDGASPTPTVEVRTEWVTPTPTPVVYLSSVDPFFEVPPNMEQRVFVADLIARVKLISTEVNSETVLGNDGKVVETYWYGGVGRVEVKVAPVYRPIWEYRFQVIEHLKGDSAQVVRLIFSARHTLATEEEALEVAEWWANDRDAQWDDREALVFLPWPLVREPGQGYVKKSNQDDIYSINEDESLEYMWLPARDDPSTVGRAEMYGDPGSDELVYLEAAGPGEEGNERPTTTLGDVRASIERVAALLKEGEGIEGYERCIGAMLARERSIRAGEARSGRPFERIGIKTELSSGLPRDSEVYAFGISRSSLQEARHWLTGPDVILFHIDVDTHAVATTRPIPSGVYSITWHFQHRVWIPCNFLPDDPPSPPWTITVTAPPGTLHEAFFDPAALGTGVGSSKGAGVLDPRSFSVRNQQTALSSLTWEPNTGAISLGLNPFASMAGYQMDLIALDGSITLTLSFDEASMDSGSRLYSWPSPKQPWQDGDKLMIRIRE